MSFTEIMAVWVITGYGAINIATIAYCDDPKIVSKLVGFHLSILIWPLTIIKIIRNSIAEDV